MAETIDSGIYRGIQTKIPEVIQLQIPDFVGDAQRVNANNQLAAARDINLKQDAQAYATSQADLAEDKAAQGIVQANTHVGANGELVMDRKAVLGNLASNGFVRSAQLYAKQFDAQDQAVATKNKLVTETKIAETKDRTARAGAFHAGVLALPEAERAAAYASWAPKAKADGTLSPDAPDAYDPTFSKLGAEMALSPDKREERNARVALAQDNAQARKDAAALAAEERRTRDAERRDDRFMVTGTGPYAKPQPVVAPGDEGKISGVVVDKTGNRKIDPQVFKSLSESQKAADGAKNFLAKVPTDTTLKQASASGVGEFGAKLQDAVGANGPGTMASANAELARFATDGLGVLQSPLMKGAPSEGDARRALGVINQPNASYENKVKAISEFKAAVEDALKNHNDAVGQYDSETQGKLKGVGVKSVDGVSTKPSALSDGEQKVLSSTPKNKSGGAILTMAQVKANAARTGRTVQEVTNAVIAAGGTVQ